jgi:hypothetical protein
MSSTTIYGVLLLVFLFLSILGMLEAGRYWGRKRRAEDPEGAREGIGAVDGALFGVMGLLIAFTFSGAASRYDTRRDLVVTEANAIGTAYLRLDLLPARTQAELRDDFRRYVDSRLAVYRALPDLAAAKDRLAASTEIQNQIWSKAVTACNASEVNGNAVTSLVIAALNDMIDITTTRAMVLQAHPPGMVYAMLVLLVLVGGLLAGYGTAAGRRRSWMHLIGYAALMAISIYIIIDFEFPRVGLIRLDRFDRVLVEVRESMK